MTMASLNQEDERNSDKLLRFGEISVVISITFVILLLICYGVYWLVWCDQQTRSSRLGQLAKSLNENWKVSLILLVPLFYRTIRIFLERVEKAFGIEAPHRQPPVGEKGSEIRQSELQNLPSEESAPPEATSK